MNIRAKRESPLMKASGTLPSTPASPPRSAEQVVDVLRYVIAG